MVRAFIAVEPPQELKRSMLAAVPGMKGVRVLDESITHITLAFLGDVERGKLEALKGKLSAISMYPFEVAFSGAGLLGSRGHAVLYANVSVGADTLSSLGAAVSAACREVGIPTEARGFLPHMTIGRIRDTNQCGPELERFVRGSKNAVSGSFMCDSFCLESSMLTPSGPFYTRLLEVRLRGWQ